MVRSHNELLKLVNFMHWQVKFEVKVKRFVQYKIGFITISKCLKGLSTFI